MDKEKIQLKRIFGYCWGTSFLITNVIGTGIFVAPKGVLKYSCMNVGLSLCIWTVVPCALLSMMTTLCSAEIDITFPRSGAHYYFLKRCFGNLISFLNLWTSLFLGPGLAASQALLLAEYSIEPFYPSCSAPKLPKKCLALAVLWTVGILNSRGVKEVTWLQTASLVLKMAILGLISLSGVMLLVRGRKENVERFQNSFDTDFPEASEFIEAIFQGYFAFSGGGCFTYIAGELKKPRKTIPRCIFTALPLVTIIYLLVNISYLTVLTPREILSSDAVAITWTDRVIPSLTWVIPFGVSASIFSNLLANVLESSRVTYMAGQEGQLPLLFNMLNIHSSPFISVLVLVTMASIAIVSTNLTDLINYLYFVVFIWSVLSMIGILKLRYQEPNLPRPYKVFFPLPLVTMAISLYLVLVPLVKSPHMHYIYVCLFVLSGLLFYIPLIYLKLRLVWFEKMTCHLQLLFNICIPDVAEEQMSEVQTF
ncbi:LOW QUALITY PROTEIN: solute carrier family 7 member 13 [Panthera pardus]|uniref:LOW QUALITY PROTEIN: solute carrier family 7 member 13 n=1 Tax=Panthera pardus TaxID=9691 RepID=A0A9V1FTP8_PANPR|nr:LOW QUALITY PROTEIN: solute carrier family 7 member 13 [Panthera pardus]